MTSETHCPSCGRSRPRDSRAEVCPACEFAGALATLPSAPANQPCAPPEEPASASGSTRLGDYELLEEIAHGGMGVVYRARQVSLNRIVAVKMILAGERASPHFVQRFRTEAEAAAKLQHASIIAIHEVGEHDGRQFFSMEYVEGSNLHQLAWQKPLASKRAARYLQAVAVAIHYAHEQGVLHRDLKPSNVLIGPSDQPKITDFGLAKVLTSDTDLTLSGQVLGTPHYLPPEQASGKRGKVGPWSDVYGLGAILYYLLTGRPPFQAEELTEVLDQVLHLEPISPRLLNPSVPRDLETICLKCLEKEAARRYGSAQEVADDLGRHLRSETIVARPVSPMEKGWRWCRRKPALAGALAACLAALVLGVAGISWQWRRAETEARSAQSRLYYSDMLLAQQALTDNHLGRVEELLQRHDPRFSAAPDADLRGWEWRRLWRQIQSEELFTLGSHTGTVSQLAVSPDGRTVASVALGDFVDELSLWDLKTRQPIASLPEPQVARGMSLSFSPGGDTLAVALGSPPGVRLYQGPDWRSVATPTAYTNPIGSVAFLPNGTLLAALESGEQGVLHLVETSRYTEVAGLPTGGGRGLAISPDSRWIAIMLKHRDAIHVWDRNAQALARELPGPGNAYRNGNVVFSPNGQMLAVVISTHNRVDFWAFPECRLLHSIQGGTIGLTGVVFSPDSRLAYVAASDQRISIHQTRDWEEIGHRRGHRDEVWCLAISPDGGLLVSGSRDHSLRVWSALPDPAPREQLALPQATRQLCLSADGSALLTVSTNEMLQVWKTRDFQRIAEHPYPTSDYYRWSNRQWTQAAVGPLGDRLALSAGTHLGATDSGEFLKVWDLPALTEWRSFRELPGIIAALDLSADGKHLAAAGFWGAKEALVWEVDSGQVVARIPTPRDRRSGLVKFAPDATRLAIRSDSDWSWGFEVEVWNLATLRRERTLYRPGHRVTDLAFSPDQRQLATAGEDAIVCVWNLEQPQAARVLSGQLTSFTSVTWSPDGTRLFGGGDDGSLTVWETESYQQVSRFQAHSDRVVGLACLDANGTLVSASLTSLKLWRAPEVAGTVGAP